MVFQGEDVPLTEDVLKRPPAKFIQTRAENSADDQIQVVESSAVNLPAGNRTTIYSVPKGRRAYITKYSFSISHIAGVAGTGRVQFRINNRAILETFQFPMAIDHDFSSTVNLSMPILLNELEEVDIFNIGSGQTLGVAGSVFGWEESRKIS